MKYIDKLFISIENEFKILIIGKAFIDSHCRKKSPKTSSRQLLGKSSGSNYIYVLEALTNCPLLIHCEHLFTPIHIHPCLYALTLLEFTRCMWRRVNKALINLGFRLISLDKGFLRENPQRIFKNFFPILKAFRIFLFFQKILRTF